MKKWFVLFVVAMLVVPCTHSAYAFGKKKKKDKDKNKVEVVVPKKKESKYEKLLKTSGTETKTGKFITLHRINGKIYFEYPVNLLGRELLIASTTSESSNSEVCAVGYKVREPMHVKFEMIDSTIYMRGINSYTDYDKNEDAMKKAVDKNFISPFMKKYKLEAYNQDSSAVVFEVTPLFTGNEQDLSPVADYYGMFTVSASPKSDLTFLGKMKSFDDNITVETNMTYNCTLKYFIFQIPLGDVSTKVTRTVLLLPEDKMKPRVSDSRVSVFFTPKQYLSTGEDKIQNFMFANRWRLEPQDMKAWERGELVEPVKPIVWYVDDAFPELWKQPIKDAVLNWNKAFEAIGFKNVMQVYDFPKDDPNFDPDNLKYSCIRYLPISVENAMGPSWVDPTTGEIINASVIVYNDVIKLINNWRFTQTAQIDPRVRGKKLTDELLKESLEYVLAHEIGHTLGLMHNMAASRAYPVDSLRSAAFTQKYGTTPSIMDYARFNYVAQPTDKGVRLTPPDLGVYDYYTIKWLYSPIAGNLSVKDEAKVLEGWVDEKAGDPIYRYGKQQIYSRYDPSAIEEDLGDDAVKAGEYGIKNLKYILSNVNNWISDDESADHRMDLYNSIAMQYYRYVMNAMYNVGGVYLTEVKDGTPGVRSQSVPRDIQKASMKWVLKQLRNSDWVDDKALISKFGLNTGMSSKVMAAATAKLLTLGKNVTVSSYLADKPYTVKEYFDDLYNGIWENTINGRKLTAGDKQLQRAVIAQTAATIKGLTDKKAFAGEGVLKGINKAYLPSVDEIHVYGLDESGMTARYLDLLREVDEEYGKGTVAAQIIKNQFGDAGSYGWQRELDVTSVDETPAYYCNMLEKVTRLLESRVNSANPDDQAHYQSLLLILKATRK